MNVPQVSQIILSGFCIITILAGTVVLLKMQGVGILHRFVLEIIGLTFLVPFVLLLRFFDLISADAATSLAGAMVGYFFRAGSSALNPKTPSGETDGAAEQSTE